MKKATHKILMAAASLVIALGVASGTTFAWFTSNRSVTLGQIEASVTSGTDGLYIALRGKDGNYGQFKTSLTSAELNDAIYAATTKNSSVLLDHMTTMNASTNTHGVNLYNRDGNAVPAFTLNSTTEGVNNYIEFKLKIKSTVRMNIYLMEDNGLAEGEGKVSSDITYVNPANTNNDVLSWKAADASVYGTALTEGGKIAARGADAARVAFVSAGAGKVWAPHEDSALGVATNSTGLAPRGYSKGNIAEDYFQHFINESYSATAAATSVVNEIGVLPYASLESKSTTGATAIADTTDDCVVEVTVKLWLEGTDGDCLNSIFEDGIKLELIFGGIAVTPAP